MIRIKLQYEWQPRPERGLAVDATLFEVLYLFAWYAGPMQRIDWLDYTGVTTARSAQLWLLYGVAAAGLLVLAALGRARQARG